MDARPETLNHNIETVRRVFPRVRPKGDYDLSLQLLAKARELTPDAVTKSGMMVGLGEAWDEILETMRDLRSVDCDLLTIGQYLQPTRNHLRTLAEAARLCAETDENVTVINGDKKAGRKILSQLEESFPESRLRVIDRPLTFDAYLRLVASHRLVFQLDRGSVPGQVAGDALLCRTLCAGGNSAIEELAFPDFCDDSRISLSEAVEKISAVLSNDSDYLKAVDKSQSLAAEKVSYSAVARQLKDFLLSSES